MLRRDLLRAVMATPLAGWLRPWRRLPSAFGKRHPTIPQRSGRIPQSVRLGGRLDFGRLETATTGRDDRDR